MLGELIFGILLIQHIHHVTVTAHLRQNGGGGDRGALTVALHQKAVWLGNRKGFPLVTISVNQRHVEGLTESFHSEVHGLHTGAQDVRCVDLGGLDAGNAVGNSGVDNDVKKFNNTIVASTIRYALKEINSMQFLTAYFLSSQQAI